MDLEIPHLSLRQAFVQEYGRPFVDDLSVLGGEQPGQRRPVNLFGGLAGQQTGVPLRELLVDVEEQPFFVPDEGADGADR